MRLEAVCTGQATPVAAKSGLTGHRKRPRAGAVAIGRLGLDGDTIVDTDHHGGPDQAVYLFTAPDRAAWEARTGAPMRFGAFGENLCIDGLESAALCIGDRFAIGEVILEVTSPRIPCATFAAVSGLPAALRLFIAVARPGAYLRVLHPGVVRAGDHVRHLPWTGVQVTLAEVFRFSFTSPNDAFLSRVRLVPAHVQLLDRARNRVG